MSGAGICWVGGARYGRPLDPTSAKKFATLRALGPLAVLGFAEDARPRRFFEHADFWLLPSPPPAPLRYLALALAGPPILLHLALRRGVRTFVAQSPYEGVAAALAKRAAARRGVAVRLVVESHGDFERALFLQRRVASADGYRLLMRLAARHTFAAADALRAVSGATRRQLAAWAPGLPVVQFPAWTDIGAFREARPAPGSPEVVFAGALTPLKGAHVLLDAFARLAPRHPAARLALAGAAPDPAYAAALRRQAERLGLAGRVVFPGHLPQPELAALVAGARVFALPSFSEGLGRVVFEAMACGVPVVASRVGGVPELVEDGATGLLVPPGDAAALAGAIGRLLEDPDAAGRMGRRGRLAAEAIFSEEAYVAGYRALLEMPCGIGRAT